MVDTTPPSAMTAARLDSLSCNGTLELTVVEHDPPDPCDDPSSSSAGPSSRPRGDVFAQSSPSSVLLGDPSSATITVRGPSSRSERDTTDTSIVVYIWFCRELRIARVAPNERWDSIQSLARRMFNPPPNSRLYFQRGDYPVADHALADQLASFSPDRIIRF